MIRGFRDRATEKLWSTGKSRKIPASLLERVQSKLAMLDAAIQLSDLASPPGNRLEALHGDRNGQHSIRVNDQSVSVFVGIMAMHSMSKSRIIIDRVYQENL